MEGAERKDATWSVLCSVEVGGGGRGSVDGIRVAESASKMQGSVLG